MHYASAALLFRRACSAILKVDINTVVLMCALRFYLQDMHGQSDNCFAGYEPVGIEESFNPGNKAVFGFYLLNKCGYKKYKFAK